MKAERWAHVEELLVAALERNPGERAALVDGIDDEQLRREVLSLLAVNERARDFIEAPAVAFASDGLSQVRVVETMAGRRIGPYQILRELGCGGMGSVFLAARADQQYKKQVAIKLVKQGFDNAFIVNRFFSERQILANLDHPNIARLIDGGATDGGLPYLVMDYVEGLPIDEYCDSKKLPTVERLRLFRTVCAAVQYAHRNLVVHRDIKPSNILITEDGTAKLLDFGIAKLLDPEGAQPQEQTATIARIMTPHYASPEQVRGERITTASDIYSLGVLFYKLLTGHHPYRFKNLLPTEIEKIICEKEPDKPSTAITRVEQSTDGHGATTRRVTPESVGAARGEQPESLRRRLRGDLDNIVLMAMRKAPERRYSSVERFSEDIGRHLEGLPVIARKDTFGYRSAKFIKRNKVGVAAAALIVLTLVAGVVATAWQARVAASQAKLAREQAAIATEQRDKARIETGKAERINAFLQRIMSYADPSWYSPGSGKGRDVKVIDALNEAAGRIDTELADQPEVRAELHHTIGNTYRALGISDASERHFRAALELYRGIYGEQHPKVAESLFYLAAALDITANFNGSDLGPAEALYRQAIEMMRAVDNENGSLPYVIQDLGGILIKRGETEAAEPLLREAIEMFRRRYGEEHMGVTASYTRFGSLYEARGDLNQAQAMFEKALEGARRSRDDLALAGPLKDLGLVHELKGEYSEAEALIRQALDLYHKFAGENDPATLGTLNTLAHVHYLKREYASAEAEARSALESERRALPKGHRFTCATLSLLSVTLIKAGKPAQAQPYLREALAMYRASLGNDVILRNNDPGLLGECLTLLRRYGEAESILSESYSKLKARYGEQHPRTADVRQHLVELYEASGKREQAAS